MTWVLPPSGFTEPPIKDLRVPCATSTAEVMSPCFKPEASSVQNLAGFVCHKEATHSVLEPKVSTC